MRQWLYACQWRAGGRSGWGGEVYIRQSSAPAYGSDMHGLTFHVGTDLRAEGLIRYQVHREAQNILDVELHSEVRLRCGGAVEAELTSNNRLCTHHLLVY